MHVMEYYTATEKKAMGQHELIYIYMYIWHLAARDTAKNPAVNRTALHNPDV